jgi:hypothetical protein
MSIATGVYFKAAIRFEVVMYTHSAHCKTSQVTVTTATARSVTARSVTVWLPELLSLSNHPLNLLLAQTAILGCDLCACLGASDLSVNTQQTNSSSNRKLQVVSDRE